MKKNFLVGGTVALAAVTLIGSLLWAQPGTTTPARPATPAAPQTRVALLNLTQVIKGYKKYDNFQTELKTLIQSYQTKDASFRSQIESDTKNAQNPQTAAAQREALEKNVRRLQREMEDNNNDAKAVLGKKSDDEMLLLYKEVQDAAQRFAVARNYDLVLTYNDAPIGSPEFFQPMNVARRMQTVALMPMYHTPGMDISKEVMDALNAAYRGPVAPAPTTTTPGTGTTTAPRPGG